MSSVEQLEQRVLKIEKRNSSVEIDKAWEDSWIRKGLIMLFTYLSIAAYLYFIVKVDPWVNAIVPTIGFLLSTLSLPFFKNLWKKHIFSK